MVFFICDTCGETLKKAKVQNHKYQCRGMSTVSCIDCNQNFDLRTFNNHKQCLHEDEKYGGANYQKKESESKGQRKQEQWIENVREVAKNANVSAKIKEHLETILTYDNIPRKKAKFANFARNSVRGLNPQAIDQLWSVFEKANQNNAANQTQNGNTNGKQNDSSNKRPAEEDECNNKDAKKSKTEEVTKKVNDDTDKIETTAETEASTPVTKLNLIKIAKQILKENDSKMKRKKFDKKVYKSYENGDQLEFDEFTQKLYTKLGKKASKFVITDKYIELA